jgi:hypothetical protein
MIDHQQISDDVKTRLETVSGDPKFNKVFNEMDSRDENFGNMPLANVRWSQDNPAVRAGQDYVVEVILEVEIIALSLQTRKEACTIRDQLITKARNVIRQSPTSGLTASGESIVLGPATATGVEQDEKTGGFKASATLQVIVIVFADRS